MFANSDREQVFAIAVAQAAADYAAAMVAQDPAWRATPEDPAVKLLTALERRSFSFALEPWHDIKAAQTATPSRFCSEMLLRPKMGGEGFAPFPGISALNMAGIAVPLDKALLLASLEQAERDKTLPVSINLSAQTVTDRDFWRWVHDDLPRLYPNIGPDMITFEITEDAAADNAPADLINVVKAQGYRLAIDDFTLDDLDQRRLRNLAAMVDFVKIQGRVTEAGSTTDGVYSNPLLEQTVQRIRDLAPGAFIVCEWVSTPQQAVLLARQFGIDGAQGRNLPMTYAAFVAGLTENDSRPAVTLPRAGGPQP